MATTPTLSDLYSGVQDLLGRRQLLYQQELDLLTGTASGGPNGDGLYPIDLTAPADPIMLPSWDRFTANFEGLRPLPTFGAYGTADDTATWQAALDSGEPFYVPELQPDAGQIMKLSKVSTLSIPSQAMIYGAGFKSGIEILPDGLSGMVTDPSASYITIEGIQIWGNWPAQPTSATGTAHGLHIAGGYDNPPIGYSNSPIRAKSPVNSQDPRHRINVKVWQAAGAGVRWEGRGASVGRMEIYECCDGFQMFTFDNQFFFDVGSPGRHGVQGNGYTGNNISIGKSWFAGCASGQASYMTTKLTDAGIDPFQDWYNIYLSHSDHAQWLIQTQDGSGGAIYATYSQDQAFYGHIEKPGDAVYNGSDKNNDDGHGHGVGKPGSAAIVLDNCSNFSFNITAARKSAISPGSIDNCNTLIRVSGTAAQGHNFQINQRGWTAPDCLDGPGGDWTGGFTNPNYIRLNGKVMVETFGARPDDTLQHGLTVNASLLGRKIWGTGAGTSGSLEGVVDDYFQNLYRLQWFNTAHSSFTDVIKSDGANLAVLQFLRFVVDGTDSFRIGYQNTTSLAQLPASGIKIYGPASSFPNRFDLFAMDALLTLSHVASGTGGGFKRAITIDGDATGAKLGFYTKTPIAQQTLPSTPALSDVVTALKNLGLVV